MLVDLGRNDLSRVCRARDRAGRSASWRPSASRTSPISSRRWSESCATASGRSTCSARASRRRCPARRMRAMQLIAELEGRRRGPYRARSATRCRAVTSIPASRSGRSSCDEVAHLQARAGIVADSDPSAEHEECLRKLAALETRDYACRAMILLVTTPRLVHATLFTCSMSSAPRCSCAETTRSTRTRPSS